jgi:hypothetical protein
MNEPIVEQLGEMNPLGHARLTCKIYRNPDGSPIKSPEAIRFPALSRRQRRAISRQVLKEMRKKPA